MLEAGSRDFSTCLQAEYPQDRGSASTGCPRLTSESVTVLPISPAAAAFATPIFRYWAIHELRQLAVATVILCIVQREHYIHFQHQSRKQMLWGAANANLEGLTDTETCHRSLKPPFHAPK